MIQNLSAVVRLGISLRFYLGIFFDFDILHSLLLFHYLNIWHNRLRHWNVPRLLGHWLFGTFGRRSFGRRAFGRRSFGRHLVCGRMPTPARAYIRAREGSFSSLVLVYYITRSRYPSFRI